MPDDPNEPFACESCMDPWKAYRRAHPNGLERPPLSWRDVEVKDRGPEIKAFFGAWGLCDNCNEV
jgi:hypothetical protein